MAHFSAGALTFRLLILASAAFGTLKLGDARPDVLPELRGPCAVTQIEALGLCAVEVERLNTVPIEADLLNGVEGVGINRSDSLPSKSSTV
jgi:Cu/Ag efflux pump CusA